jgi:TonB family protein
LLPETVPPPFLEIARQCLRLDPQRRWTVPDIAARLLPTAPPPRKSFARRYGLAAALVVLVAGAAIIGDRFVGGAPESRSPQSQSQTQVTEPAPAGSASQNGVPATEQRAPASTTVPATTPNPATTNPPPAPAKSDEAKQPANTPPETNSGAAPAAPPTPPSATSSAQSAPGAVAERFLPPVSQRARNTISGKVRVAVKVDVDTTGKVTQARLEAAGPSHYFARLAEDASRRWKFQPPQHNGEAVPSQWLLRYAFGRADTDVQPMQISPHK